jgi:anti-anti-sigma factor
VSTTGFRIDRQDADGRVVFELHGELDLAAEVEFRRRIDSAGPDGTVVLDLSGLSFMDSTGLRLLLETDTRMRDGGGRCVIVRGSGVVHRVIAQGMLESRLEVVDDLAGLN